jgi:hypothetical protein
MNAARIEVETQKQMAELYPWLNAQPEPAQKIILGLMQEQQRVAHELKEIREAIDVIARSIKEIFKHIEKSGS